MTQPRSRRREERENRAQRLADRTIKREKDAVKEEDAVDRMIRQNIEDHGA